MTTPTRATGTPMYGFGIPPEQACPLCGGYVRGHQWIGAEVCSVNSTEWDTPEPPTPKVSVAFDRGWWTDFDEGDQYALVIVDGRLRLTCTVCALSVIIDCGCDDHEAHDRYRAAWLGRVLRTIARHRNDANH